MKFLKKIGFSFLFGSLLVFVLVTGNVLATAGEEGSIESEEVEMNLELPDLYENTIIYNGTVNPELLLAIRMPDEDIVDYPYVNEDGQFSINFTHEEFVAGDEISFLLGKESYENEEIGITIQPKEEDMEVVQSSADTSAVEEVIIDGTEITWPEGVGSVRMNVSTIGDLDGAPYYAREGMTINENTQLEYVGETGFTALLNIAENYEEANDPDFPQPGEKVTVYITALGVTAEVESEISEKLDAWYVDEANAEDSQSNNDDNGEGSIENNQSESDHTDSVDEPTTDHTDPSDSEDNEVVENAATSSNVSNANGGTTSPITWILIGILVLAILFVGIFIVRKRRKA
ncbi:hypothetical protein [Alkalicoccobacillus murimartini]|uniref:LPXTG cell wall anchor domain-containing protein n=1 Tax=Alkalicoccobacillus murimartini TaxID=171685 RepID=A0ABT9YKD9_9BACI|nr:hypothetical protein [Alkalicoccobacillus murimartini]MDQ0208339.1 hypothetical protein [Alkalicoccobacillus murimartini]